MGRRQQKQQVQVQALFGRNKKPQEPEAEVEEEPEPENPAGFLKGLFGTLSIYLQHAVPQNQQALTHHTLTRGCHEHTSCIVGCRSKSAEFLEQIPRMTYEQSSRGYDGCLPGARRSSFVRICRHASDVIRAGGAKKAAVQTEDVVQEVQPRAQRQLGAGTQRAGSKRAGSQRIKAQAQQAGSARSRRSQVTPS